MLKLVLAVLAVSACAASNAEITTAKTASYKGSATQLYDLAMDVALRKYKIAETDPVHTEFWTAPRFYSPEGDLQSEGAGDFVHVDNHSVNVAFHVDVVETSENHTAVTVTPRTFQVLSGSPKPRELRPDDPNLPPFVLGRADALTVEIYEQARSIGLR